MPEFTPLLPNAYGPPLTLTPREEEELRILRNSAVLYKSLHNTLSLEYAAFLARNPLKQSPQDVLVQHAYLSGMHTLASVLCHVRPTT
jgi:hypothetical protein